MGRSGWRQGYYKPKNPQKYLGNTDNIRYMSSWEYELCRVLDHNPSILQWSSETIAIPYIKPTTGKPAKYYPDYFLRYKNKRGEIISEIVEVKPSSQIKPPQTTGKNKKQQLREQITYAINQAKWEAAQQFCQKQGISFRVISEQQMFK